MTTIANTDVGIEILYRNRNLYNIAFDAEIVQEYNANAQELGLAPISTEQSTDKGFNIPEYYKNIDVEEYITKLIPTSGDSAIAVKERVETELALFKAKNLFPVLQLMIYIIDTMRKHELVWGVGRGSSVASYCLYLIGVHKVDSIKYNLDIREFLKEENNG